MKNPALFNKTISILVKAYQNDTLEHGICSACAVGNLCNGSGAWSHVFYTCTGGQIIKRGNYFGWIKETIDATGYTWQELAKIEYSFETAKKGSTHEEWNFNGLMAVCDALMKIHEATPEETESAKLQFVKA